MRSSEKKLYEEEAEIRPNRYVAIALTVLSFFIIGMLMVNEIGVFRVDKERMRFGAFAALIVLDMPLFAAGTDKGLRNSKTKYLMIGCVSVATAILCIVLSFHATLILVLPILLAAQYPSVKMSRIAMICGMLCAFFSPLISYLVGTWDTSFIEWLLKVTGQAASDMAGGESLSRSTLILQILIYLSFPHALILLAFYPLSSAIAYSGETRLKNQIQILHMSESDTLTGLLNRMSFEQMIEHEAEPDDGNVAVVYINANDLTHLNDEAGRAEGDRMLICIAQILREAFGDECAYRTGGSEFVMILHGLTLSQIKERITQVRAGAEVHAYSVSIGFEYAQAPCTLPALVNAAEAKMLIDKKKTHLTQKEG